MTATLTPEEWGVLRTCADDGTPPKEALFPEAVYRALAARGLMRIRIGPLPPEFGPGLAEFYLATPAGAEAAGMKLCKLDVQHQGPCVRVLSHVGPCAIDQRTRAEDEARS